MAVLIWEHLDIKVNIITRKRFLYPSPFKLVRKELSLKGLLFMVLVQIVKELYYLLDCISSST